MSSRISKIPVLLPEGVEAIITAEFIEVKGPLGTLRQMLNNLVNVTSADRLLHFFAVDQSKQAIAMSGTLRMLVKNIVDGVTKGFEKKLTLVGVGFRAQAQGKKITMQLGFSHSIEYEVPEDIELKTPSQTEIIVKGIDKQKVGQVAADIRAYRKPEPYKGKGVRYSDEVILLKETKKK